MLYIYNPFPCIKLSKADFRYCYCYYKALRYKKQENHAIKFLPGGVDTIHIGKYRYHGWTKATDGCFKRRQPSFFMAVIAAEREINMAITGIGYGRTLMYTARICCDRIRYCSQEWKCLSGICRSIYRHTDHYGRDFRCNVSDD